MNSVQESKNELEASIRYAENAISSAKQTIESMEFRQEMAQKNYQEQTGREEALTKQVTEFKAQMALLKERIADMQSDMVGDAAAINTLKEEREMLEKSVKYLRDENERLKREKEASSGPCGCQAYRDLEERVDFYDKEFQEMTQGVYAPTMPVIPKDVAIAIFREGTLFGVEAVCDEIQGETINIEESEYVHNFEVSFTKEIDLDDVIDFDWVRGKIGDYDEDNVTANLEGLCAKNNFECRIHGVDDNTIDLTKKND